MANRRQRQRGAMLIAFSILLIVVLGFIGLALDVGQVIGRKTELQNLADNAAMAAAAELVGTPEGLAAAVDESQAQCGRQERMAAPHGGRDPVGRQHPFRQRARRARQRVACGGRRARSCHGAVRARRYAGQ